MGAFYVIIAIIWSILCLILFIKVWGMTNDVREIKNHLLHSQASGKIIASPALQKTTTPKDYNFKKGDEVIEINSGETLRIVKILNEEYCICQMWDLREKKFPISNLRLKENK